jgi:general secretion pathway protein G
MGNYATHSLSVARPLPEMDIDPDLQSKLNPASFSSGGISRVEMNSHGKHERGFTLLELIVAATILTILTLLALPLTRVTIKREKERELRHALWEMRDAIDRYKDAADRGAFQIKADSFGYPPTLDDLVKGVDVQGKKTRFLRRIPVDPMTGTTDWGMRSMQDDADSDSWGGQAVFDVYTKSESTGLDGTKYKDW